ncbi:unnamed protein product [Macrosiphum euphorbiae]|uniref:Integral membrane protein 2 n=1 Tax=Macrosiphum euphorbiae TaxID=13131 RepID=A0AAV0VSZ0_9HEMI|nr:unnamed protein product [Macrosiphum euphorbiae]
MTILTFPSFGGKSDKAPLISDEVHHDQTQPPPPYHPKFLETGEGGLPNTKNNNNGTGSSNGKSVGKCIHQSVEYRRLVHKMAKFTAILFVFLLVLYFAIDTLCKAYVHDIQQKQQDTEDDAAAVPCKSYSSYADAENDMILLPDSPPPSAKNMVISMVINPGEGVIRKSPQITINKSARFLHDFSVNITGIVDFQVQRCYVMPLLRNSVEPPESLYDMLLKMSTGYYSVDMNKIISNFHMVRPAITNLSDYGMYISKDCADYPTFKLEKDIATDSPIEVY